MPTDPKMIGIRIRNARLDLGLTQAQLAEKASLDSVYLGQVERGIKNLSIDSLVRIADSLKVSAGDLVDGKQTGKVDPLTREISEILCKYDKKKRQALLRALRMLSEI
jgi:transcriptional regulator with XRE-family HTH domain